MMKIDQDTHFLIGKGLNRPECVIAHRSGWLFMPYWGGSGGISAISPQGRTHHILVMAPDDGIDLPLRPNGIALEEGGSFIIAHMGSEKGGVYRLTSEGRVSCITDRIGTAPMLPVNYATRDSKGRYWITVSTTIMPRADDYRADAASGFIAMHQDGKTRIVADGLGYTNECLLSADESILWVNETFGRRLTAFDVTEDGLANRRILATFGHGTYPDGMTETEDGSIIVTSIISNRLLRIDPKGRVETLLEDADPAYIDEIEAVFQAGRLNKDHLATVKSKRLANISNIAFGGEDLRTAYLGCLLGDQLSAFRSSVAGRRLPHWDVDISALLSQLESRV